MSKKKRPKPVRECPSAMTPVERELIYILAEHVKCTNRQLDLFKKGELNEEQYNRAISIITAASVMEINLVTTPDILNWKN